MSKEEAGFCDFDTTHCKTEKKIQRIFQVSNKIQELSGFCFVEMNAFFLDLQQFFGDNGLMISLSVISTHMYFTK